MTPLAKTGLRQLRVTQFRSYEFADLSLDDALTPVVLTGRNGAGKTNILEAVSFLAPGKGLRAARLVDVARRANDLPPPDGVLQLPERWSVSAKVQTATDMMTIGTGTVDGSERRKVHVDGKPLAKQSDLGQYFRCLWLTPAQDRLFCGDPVGRRRFLDRLVQAFDAQHAVRLSEYNNAFKQWSHLLREGRFENGWLSALEEQLVLNGVAIAASRLDVVSRISAYFVPNAIGNLPTPEMVLTGVLEQDLLSKSALRVEEEFTDRLRNGRKIYADGGSVAGPHTADFKVFHVEKNRDASLSSTGEQKALLLNIILAEMKTQTAEQGRCPVLLLDEVAAHLDPWRRDELFAVLEQLPAQVWMTGTDIGSFSALYSKAQFFDIENSNLHLKNVA